MRPCIFIISLLVCALMSWAAPARAQPGETHLEALMKNYSETEKIGFAFYQLARLQPPLESWIDANPELQKAGPKVRYLMRHAERERLKTGFLSYTAYRDVITLRTAIRLRGLDNPDPEARKKGFKKAIGINFRSTEDQISFPYQLGPLWIAVQPLDLHKEEIYGISDGAYALLAQNLTPEALTGQDDVLAEILTLPVSVDIIHPIIIGDKPLWPLGMELLEIRLRDKKDKIIWTSRVERF